MEIEWRWVDRFRKMECTFCLLGSWATSFHPGLESVAHMPDLGGVPAEGIGRRRRRVCKYRQDPEMVVGEARVGNQRVYFGG